MTNSVIKLLVSRLAGFLIFLLLMIALNILIAYTAVLIFQEFVGFLNNHLVFISWITLFLVIGEIFILLKYPFNIPYPLFNATGALLIVYFFADFFTFLLSYSTIKPDFPFNIVFFIAGILVFFITLTVGYYKIFTNIPPEWKIKKQLKTQPTQEFKIKTPKQEETGQPKTKTTKKEKPFKKKTRKKKK